MSIGPKGQLYIESDIIIFITIYDSQSSLYSIKYSLLTCNSADVGKHCTAVVLFHLNKIDVFDFTYYFLP